jgi:hypothetical protein
VGRLPRLAGPREAHRDAAWGAPPRIPAAGIEALGPDQGRAAQERGTAMALETAAEFVTVLFAPSPQAPPGAEKLSARERELITLVAQGHTDAQIAGQLFISVRTVGSHLDRLPTPRRPDPAGPQRRPDLSPRTL